MPKVVAFNTDVPLIKSASSLDNLIPSASMVNAVLPSITITTVLSIPVSLMLMLLSSFDIWLTPKSPEMLILPVTSKSPVTEILPEDVKSPVAASISSGPTVSPL